jgi:hypothetical protein
MVPRGSDARGGQVVLAFGVSWRVRWQRRGYAPVGNPDAKCGLKKERGFRMDHQMWGALFVIIGRAFLLLAAIWHLAR